MNINPKIEKMFKGFKIDGKRVPISYLQYFGTDDVYLTYYTWNEKPELFFDDDYDTEVCFGTIDIWSKGNFKPIVELVKQKLKENGFNWTDNGAEMYEPDTSYFHVPVNFCAVAALLIREEATTG